MGVKKSNFNSQSSIADSDTLDFVTSGGTNKKITFSNFLALLGVTGSIASIGDVSATPVLYKAGTVNNIRNLEDGQGIKASVSPQNGALIEHNFVNGASGQAIYVDQEDLSVLFRSLVAGSGINLAVVDDTIVVTATDITTAANVVIVNSMADFPAAVAGVITLADDTGYLISAELTTSNRFVFGDHSVVFGSDRFIGSITYTGSDTLFTGTNISAHIKDLTLTAATGKIFDASSTLGTGDLFLFDNVTIDSCDELGSLTGFDGVRISQITLRDIKTNGLSFTGTNGVLLVDAALIIVNGGAFLNLGTATFNSFACTACFATLASGTYFIDGAASSANITVGNLGSVSGSRFFGLGDPLNNITGNDARWQFVANDGIADTRPDALISLNNNATATVITVATIPVKIAGTWTPESASQFTTDATGKVTYTGGKTTRVPVSASLTGEPASGVSKTITYHLYKNGLDVGNADQSNIISAGGAKNTSLLWQLDMDTNDYLELYVSNDSDTIDVTVSDAIFRVN